MKSNMKGILTLLLCLTTISMYGKETYDISVENSDGIKIYYDYISNGEELSVTCVKYDFTYPRSDYKGTIRIPETVTYMNRTRKVTKIGQLAFYGCSLNSLIIPKTVKTIGRRAFMKCNIESINLPEGLNTIDYEAFLDCKMKSINIPSTVKYVYAEAFSGCTSLEKVIVSDIAAFFNIRFQTNWPAQSTTYDTTYPQKYGNLYSDENTQIQDLVIPEGPTYIPLYMFKRQKGLHTIKLPSSIEEIRESAFEECTASIIFSEGLKWIKDKAFYKCSGLSYLNLPESLITIGTSAFEDSSVDSVYIPNSILEIRKKAFSGCDIPVVISAIENPFEISTDVFSKNTYYNATLYVPVGTMELYKNTKGWNSFNYIVERISSGIKDFTVDNKTSNYIYDINGRKLKNPQKGINIIGGKKILIK